MGERGRKEGNSEVGGDGVTMGMATFFFGNFITSQLARENRGLDHLWTESRRNFNIMKGELKTPGLGRFAKGGTKGI